MVFWNRARRKLSVFATALSALALAVPSSLADNPKADSKSAKNSDHHQKGKDGNNGHGNDAGGHDSSNPGHGKKDAGKEHDHGKANDQKKGKGKSPKTRIGSVHDILGIEPDDQGNDYQYDAGSDDVQDKQMISPGAVTDKPFSGMGSDPSLPTKPGSPNTNLSGSGVAYGSVPLIKNDERSVDFLLDRLVAGAQEAALDNGKVAPTSAKLEAAYKSYARKLAKTLSRLSPEQQNLIFYGKK